MATCGAEMIIEENKCVEGIERRGRVYYMRIRVPGRFAPIEGRKEINRSLKTRDYDEAKANFALIKRALIAEWEAAFELGRGPTSLPAFDTAMRLLKKMELPYKSVDEIAAGPIEELLARVETLCDANSTVARTSAVLGALEVPAILIEEMPSIVEELRSSDLVGKNPRQLRAWRTKYTSAAASFVGISGNVRMDDITEAQAMEYRSHWQKRYASGDITFSHASKKLRFMRQLIEAYYERFNIPPSQQNNPFAGMVIAKSIHATQDPGKKRALPPRWVKRRLIDQEGLEALNAEARDIATISAETGARQSEIYDIPHQDIHLDDVIPHIVIQMKREGGDCRQIKNGASKRVIVLQGAALDAMRRHPNGFPRYRGKDCYSNAVNKLFRDNGFFPTDPSDGEGNYTIGCTRHTYEDRMIAAKFSNEERAFMMGHSIQAVRDRPEYGSRPDLKMRALMQEMVSFPTPTWTPRSIAEIRDEMDQLAEAEGFRVR